MRTKRSNRALLFMALAGITLLALCLFSVASLVSVQAATQATYQYGDVDNDNDVDAADIALLKNIVLDKSQWNPYADADRDGDVDAADFSLVRNIILARNVAQQGYEAAYNFNTSGAGTDDLAAWMNVPSRPTGVFTSESGWTNFSSGDYDDVEAEDAASFMVSGQSGNMSAVECRFKVDETGSMRNEITSLGLKVVGNSSANATMQYWTWNFNSGTWRQIGEDIAIGTTEATYLNWSEDWGRIFAQHIDSNGYLYVLVIITAVNSDLTMDYIEISLVTDTVTQTPSPTPTISATVSPTVSATPTVSPTESPTPTVSPTESPTPTISPTPTVSPTPTETCQVFWNQSSIVVSNNSNFSVAVNITNVDYLSAGQFDVFYNRSVLNVRSPLPGAGSVNDTYDRTAYGNPATGCGWQFAGPVYPSGIDIGYGNATSNSGCLRIFWTDDWTQASSFEGDCSGGDGTGQTGNGWITVITFRAVGPGTSDIAFGAGPEGGKKQVNQLLDYVIYQDYSYPCPNPTPTPCVPESALTWGANVSVTVNP